MRRVFQLGRLSAKVSASEEIELASVTPLPTPPAPPEAKDLSPSNEFPRGEDAGSAADRLSGAQARGQVRWDPFTLGQAQAEPRSPLADEPMGTGAKPSALRRQNSVRGVAQSATRLSGRRGYGGAGQDLQHCCGLTANPFSGSDVGLDISTDTVVRAMRGCDFFRTQVGEAAIPMLAPYFALCTFAEPPGKGPLLASGDDSDFVGVITSGALTVKNVDGSPLYSLAKDDTLNETLVAISRQGAQANDVFVRSGGAMLVTRLDQLELLNLTWPLEYQQLMDAFVARCISRSITDANYQPVSSSKVEGPFVALIAHDAKKQALQEFCLQHRETLGRCKLTGTSTTSTVLVEKCNLKLAYKVPSGPLGGDQSIGALIAHDLVDAVVFMKDPLSIQCHYADIEALCQLCDVRNVPHATNAVIGGALMQHIAELMDVREGIVRIGDGTLPAALMSELRVEQTPQQLVQKLSRNPTSSVMCSPSADKDSSSRSRSKDSDVHVADVAAEATVFLRGLDDSDISTVASTNEARLPSKGRRLSSASSTSCLSTLMEAEAAMEGARLVELPIEELAEELHEHESVATSFTDDELELLAELMRVLEAPRGAKFFSEGEDATSATLVLKGRIELTRKAMDLRPPDEVRLAGAVPESSLISTVAAGEMYGQEQVILDKPQTTWQVTAEAARFTRVAMLPREELMRVQRRNPVFYQRISLWLGLMVLQAKPLEKAAELNHKYLIITCDNTARAKAALISLIGRHRVFLWSRQQELIGPSDIAGEIERATGLTFKHTVQEPIMGGAMELGDLVCRSRVKAAIVLRDHAADQRSFEALLRITDLYAVPSATNPATADILVRFLGNLPA